MNRRWNLSFSATGDLSRARIFLKNQHDRIRLGLENLKKFDGSRMAQRDGQLIRAERLANQSHLVKLHIAHSAAYNLRLATHLSPSYCRSNAISPTCTVARSSRALRHSLFDLTTFSWRIRLRDGSPVTTMRYSTGAPCWDEISLQRADAAWRTSRPLFREIFTGPHRLRAIW